MSRTGAHGRRSWRACADDGLLLLSAGPHHQVVRWIPPIDVTSAEIDEALAIFWSALGKV